MEYNPQHFKISDETKCLEIASKISFAAINYLNDGKLEASHSPVYIDVKNKKIWGHFAKANPASKIIAGQEVLITFQGGHGLIKPEWYGTDNNVPTWNYVVIHLKGTIETFTDHSTLKSMLQNMSKLYSIENLNLPENLLNGITGFNLEIDEVQGKAKLGQTKSKEENLSVINQLSIAGNHDLANVMKEALDL